MNKYSHNIRKYIRDIERWLPCAGKVRRVLLSNIRLSVDSFLSENPSADTPELTAALGTPQQIVMAHIDQIDTSLLLSNLRIKKRIMYVTFCICVIFLLIWLFFVMHEFSSLLDSVSDKYYYTIT